jgi:hypothetical protein
LNADGEDVHGKIQDIVLSIFAFHVSLDGWSVVVELAEATAKARQTCAAWP